MNKLCCSCNKELGFSIGNDLSFIFCSDCSIGVKTEISIFEYFLMGKVPKANIRKEIIDYFILHGDKVLENIQFYKHQYKKIFTFENVKFSNEGINLNDFILSQVKNINYEIVNTLSKRKSISNRVLEQIFDYKKPHLETLNNIKITNSKVETIDEKQTYENLRDCYFCNNKLKIDDKFSLFKLISNQKVNQYKNNIQNILSKQPSFICCSSCKITHQKSVSFFNTIFEINTINKIEQKNEDFVKKFNEVFNKFDLSEGLTSKVLSVIKLAFFETPSKGDEINLKRKNIIKNYCLNQIKENLTKKFNSYSQLKSIQKKIFFANCAYCDIESRRDISANDLKSLTADHVISDEKRRKLKIPSKFEIAVSCCKSCNSKKANLSILEFLFKNFKLNSNEIVSKINKIIPQNYLYMANKCEVERVFTALTISDEYKLNKDYLLVKEELKKELTKREFF